jgi:hypothetical protein
MIQRGEKKRGRDRGERHRRNGDNAAEEKR